MSDADEAIARLTEDLNAARAEAYRERNVGLRRAAEAVGARFELMEKQREWAAAMGIVAKEVDVQMHHVALLREVLIKFVETVAQMRVPTDDDGMATKRVLLQLLAEARAALRESEP